MGGIIQATKQAFSVWSIILYLLVYGALGAGYFYIISQNAVLSAVVGVISSFLFFYMFNIINHTVEKKQQELRELNNYVTSVVFYLKSGKNVLQSLEGTREKAGKLIIKDIDSAIESIVVTGELDTESFKRHNFKSLDIFHKILKIKNVQGGDPNELFKKTTADINYEIGKRDELNTNKLYICREEYFVTLIIASIPLLLYFVTKDIMYGQFLSTGIVAMGTLLVFYFGLVINTLFQQRKRADINVTI